MQKEVKSYRISWQIRGHGQESYRRCFKGWLLVWDVTENFWSVFFGVPYICFPEPPWCKHCLQGSIPVLLSQLAEVVDANWLQSLGTTILAWRIENTQCGEMQGED